MRYILYSLSLVFVFAFTSRFSSAQDSKKDYNVVCVAFYNLENLFDTIDTPNVNDYEFTPEGTNKWDAKRYAHKQTNMAKAISQIGTDYTPHGAALLGVSEIENKLVLEDLVKQPEIADRNYQIVHFDGPDRRGVDVGLLYRPDYFKVTNQKSYRLTIPDRDDFYTRDQLLVSGELQGELIHVLVAHWPSRSGGEKRSQPLREAAAALGRHIVDSLLTLDPKAKIIYMGDLNDDPTNASVKKVMRAKGDVDSLQDADMFNPFYPLYQKGIGSLAYRDSWNLFDQHLISQSLLEKDFTSFRFFKAFVFNKAFLKQESGRFQGYPFRTFAGGQFLGGYSDHFPTYLLLIKEK